MKRRPQKVEEPAATYTAKKPAAKVTAAPAPKTATPQIRYAEAAVFRKAMDKVFKEHDELFRKLAQ